MMYAVVCSSDNEKCAVVEVKNLPPGVTEDTILDFSADGHFGEILFFRNINEANKNLRIFLESY